MRPYNGYYDDLDDIDDFAFVRSQAFQKMLDDYHREEHDRHANQQLGHFKGRRHHVDWNWEDDDDWN